MARARQCFSEGAIAALAALEGTAAVGGCLREGLRRFAADLQRSAPPGADLWACVAPGSADRRACVAFAADVARFLDSTGRRFIQDDFDPEDIYIELLGDARTSEASPAARAVREGALNIVAASMGLRLAAAGLPMREACAAAINAAIVDLMGAG